jgi:hypothetical protein
MPVAPATPMPTAATPTTSTPQPNAVSVTPAPISWADHDRRRADYYGRGNGNDRRPRLSGYDAPHEGQQAGEADDAWQGEALHGTTSGQSSRY